MRFLQGSYLSGLATVVLTVFAMSSSVSGAESEAVQRLIDKAEIDALLVRYTHALDTLDAEQYANVFTDDAVFEMGNGETHRGRDEIGAIITDLKQSRMEREARGAPVPALMHHVMTNGTVDFVNPSEAHHYAYWMTILGGGEEGFDVASMGHYEDVIVKRGGKWLIKSRKLLR
jgi:uncharacterized protein (TIGR02246 family)